MAEPDPVRGQEQHPARSPSGPAAVAKRHARHEAAGRLAHEPAQPGTMNLGAEALACGGDCRLAAGQERSEVAAERQGMACRLGRLGIERSVAEQGRHGARQDDGTAGRHRLQHRAPERLHPARVVVVEVEVEPAQEGGCGTRREGQHLPGSRWRAAQHLLQERPGTQDADEVAWVVGVDLEHGGAVGRPFQRVRPAMAADRAALVHEALSQSPPRLGVEHVDPVRLRERRARGQPCQLGPHPRPHRRPAGLPTQHLGCSAVDAGPVVERGALGIERRMVGHDQALGRAQAERCLWGVGEELGVVDEEEAAFDLLLGIDQLRQACREQGGDLGMHGMRTAQHRALEWQKGRPVAARGRCLQLLDQRCRGAARKAQVGQHHDVVRQASDWRCSSQVIAAR